MVSAFFVKVLEQKPVDQQGLRAMEGEWLIGTVHTGKKFLFSPRFKTAGDWYRELLPHAERIYNEQGVSIGLDELQKLVDLLQEGEDHSEGYSFRDSQGYNFSLLPLL